MLQPTRLISTPFAQEGEKTEIQNVTGEFDNSATYRLGFPPLTMQSIRLGGKPPKGTDFNGVLFDITENISFLCKGGRYQYNAGLSTLIGGYPEGSNLLLDDNVTEVVSTVAGNQNNPNINMAGWILKPNKTTAANVADASGETQQQVNYNGGSKWHSRVGGYKLNERVVLTNGDIVKSTLDGNVNDPNVDMTGWIKTNSADQIFDESGKTQQDFNNRWVDITNLLISGDTTEAKNWNKVVFDTAATKAKADSKGIYCAPRASISMAADIDLFGITDIYLAVDIKNPINTLFIGGQANTGKPFNVYLKAVHNGTSVLTGAIPAIPTIMLSGVKGGSIVIGNTNLLNIHAIGGSTSRGSNAYFRLFLDGVVRAFRVSDEGSLGWNNEFEVRGGRLIDLDITGTGYVPNNIIFDNNVFEGNLVKINFAKAWTNRIINARFEGTGSAPGITFGPDTMQNTVIQKWSGTGATRSMFDVGIPWVNLGEGNQVTTQNALEFNQVEIMALNPNTVILANPTDSAYSNDTLNRNSPKVILTPSLNGFSVPVQKTFASTGLIAVEDGDAIKFDCEYDGAILRPTIYIYDKEQKLITSGTGHINMIGVASSFVPVNGFYSLGSDQSAATLRSGGASITSNTVKYIKLAFYTGSGGFIKNITATLYTQKLFRSKSAGMADPVNTIPDLNGTVTMGFVPLGFKYLNKLTKDIYTCTLSLDTTISAINGSVITLRNATNVQIGDIVGLARDNGATAWGTVTVVSGLDVTMSNPSDVAVGARCVINRWQSYNKQATGLTSASTTAQIIAALQAAGLAI